jgi:FAD/FMN-containing dehydrogenase
VSTVDYMTGALLERTGFAELQGAIDGDLVTPRDAAWDGARLAWNLAADQQPAAVAFPQSAADVAAIVGFARERGLRVAPQGTGHGAMALGDLADTILLKTERMRGVSIDAERRIARVEAGVLWLEVVDAAAEHGLAALAGSSPDVGVVGYTLGGGLSWLSRKYGLGSNRVTAIEVVTPSGDLVRTDREHEPDLFWALRGGGGAFGVVTALEFELFPIEELTAGILWFPLERAVEVLKVWRAWTESVTEEMTSVGRILQFPPIPEIPEPVRGKSFVVVQTIWLGDEVEGERLLAPLRGLGPVMDTVERTQARELWRLHMDPEQPVPAAGDGQLLDDLDDDLIESLVARTVGSPLLSLELRHLGGEIGRRRSHHGALSSFAAQFAMYAVGMAPTPELRAAVEAAAGAVLEAAERLSAEHTYLNFAESRRSAATLFSSDGYHRLRTIKRIVDPGNVIRSNHPLPGDGAA